MAEYAVLDLRSNYTEPAVHDHANLYHVLFAADYKSAELRLNSKLLPTLHLVTYLSRCAGLFSTSEIISAMQILTTPVSIHADCKTSDCRYDICLD